MRQVHRTGGFEDVAAYSRAVRVGDHIAVSATAATDDDGRAIAPGDTYTQARTAFERALDGVTALGGSIEDVTRTRIYLVRAAAWRDAVRAHAELFDGVFPANATFYVEGFIPDGVLVEVELDAILAG
jgi:enamine deaminase RidA (YjgF/YER057c/UK114 family)